MFIYLKETVNLENTINRSRFIAWLFSVSNKDEVATILEKLRQEHPKANHYCYAYLLNGNRSQKYSDDGEPSGTAGMVILDVLLKNQLDDVLVVVVRYFGGIKLGAGGLARAYRNSIASALKQAALVKRIVVPTYKISVPFNIAPALKNYMERNCEIISISYQEQVEFNFYSDDESSINFITELTKGQKPEIAGTTKIIKPLDVHE